MSTAELTIMNADNLTAEAFSIDTDAIKAEAEKYAALTIKDADDKEGFRVLKESRLSLKKTRTAIDNRRKELGEGARLYVNKVNAVAKELIALIEPTEELLEAREKAHTEALAKLVQDKLDARMLALSEQAFVMPASVVQKMSDAQFSACIADAIAQRLKREEAERVAAEEKAAKEAAEAESRRIEDERLKAEREALDRERQELAEQRRKQEEEDAARRDKEQAALKAEQDKIDAARREQEAEFARQQAEEDARIQAEQDRLDNARREQEAELAKQREEEEARLQAQRDELARQQAEIDAANAERERIEREQRESDQRALEEADRLRLIEETKPDREKVLKFLDTLDQFEIPAMATPNGERVKQEINELLTDASTEARRWVRELLPTN